MTAPSNCIHADFDWISALPKVELHLHLEGALPIDALWALVRKYGAPPDIRSASDLRKKFRYRDFDHFLATWSWKNGFLREYEDFSHIAESVGRYLRTQNVVYAEVFCSPADFGRRGLETGRLLSAIRRGLDRVTDVRVALVVDLVRDFGPERADRMLDELAELRGEAGVVGVGIGGSEQLYPPAPFAGVYERARSLGLHTTAHAGEAAGPESIWGAIRALGVERVGHGTRAVEDPTLVDELARTGLPLEMCPISNVKTGVVRRLAEHPLKAFLERGLCVTVNSDDPLMFDNPLNLEYARVMRELDLERGQVVALLENAIHASWLADSEKARLRRQLAGVES